MYSTMYTVPLIFLCIFQIAKTENCRVSHQSIEESWEKKLMTYLESQPTTAPNDTVNVHMYVILKYFSMGTDEKTIEAGSNFVVSWYNELLKWNSHEYQGISEIVYDSYIFWEPHIELINQVDYDEYEYHYGLCTLYSSGLIFCAPKITHEAPCITKVSNWPFDVQNCTLRIGLSTTSANINVTNRLDVTFHDGAEHSASWTIVKVYHNQKQVDKQSKLCRKAAQMDITFLLQREGAGLGAIVVYPAIVLGILTLSSFLFNVHNDMRLGIISFNLLCHFWFIKEINDLIPKHSEDIPTILFYLRESLLINMFLIMFTIFLTSLRKKTKPTPSWIYMLNNTVLNSKIRLFVPRIKFVVAKKISAEKQIKSNWTDFSDVLNGFCLWLLILVYIVMICLYIPRNIFVEPDRLKYIDFEGH